MDPQKEADKHDKERLFEIHHPPTNLIRWPSRSHLPDVCPCPVSTPLMAICVIPDGPLLPFDGRLVEDSLCCSTTSSYSHAS